MLYLFVPVQFLAENGSRISETAPTGQALPTRYSLLQRNHCLFDICA